MEYVMKEYFSTGEYHIYSAHRNFEGKIVISPLVPLCGDKDVSFANTSSICSCVLRSEDDMAEYCGTQDSSFRHRICANCVGRFYKTR